MLRTHIANLRRKIEPDGAGSTSVPSRASATVLGRLDEIPTPVTEPSSRLGSSGSVACARAAHTRELHNPGVDHHVRGALANPRARLAPRARSRRLPEDSALTWTPLLLRAAAAADRACLAAAADAGSPPEPAQVPLGRAAILEARPELEILIAGCGRGATRPRGVAIARMLLTDAPARSTPPRSEAELTPADERPMAPTPHRASESTRPAPLASSFSGGCTPVSDVVAIALGVVAFVLLFWASACSRIAHMSGADVFGLAVSALVFIYLVYALVRGERF